MPRCMAFSREAWLGPVKGREPDSASYSITPADHRSTCRQRRTAASGAAITPPDTAPGIADVQCTNCIPWQGHCAAALLYPRGTVGRCVCYTCSRFMGAALLMECHVQGKPQVICWQCQPAPAAQCCKACRCNAEQAAARMAWLARHCALLTAVPSYSWPATISGAVNSGVPHCSLNAPPLKGATTPARPKSAIFGVSPSIRMFSGFKSRWITRLPACKRGPGQRKQPNRIL